MSHYTHLTIEERENLYLMAAQGEKIRKIAEALGRAPSTISRELRRNKSKHHPYRPSFAQRKYEKARRNCGRKYILADLEKRELVADFIRDAHWSPEQIANRLKLEENPLQISFASIYRAINAGLLDEGRGRRSRKASFSYHLRRKGRKKHKKGGKNRQGQYYKEHKISERSEEANERMTFGHFEADTVVGKRGSSCLVTLVDRKSRFTLAGKSPNVGSEAVCNVIYWLLSQLSPDQRRSVTPDRGPEFAQYREVSASLDNLPFYFADAHSPWQRGTNENTNGLIREFLPKGADMAPVSDADILGMIFCLNMRPRKCLSWHSPLEVFFDIPLHLT
jgi:IS30 family transposase